MLVRRLAVLAALALAACSKNPSEKLQGKWVGDDVDNLPAEQVEAATGWIKGTALTFEGGKLTVAIPAESTRTGTFKVKEGSKGPAVQLAVTGGDAPAEAKLTLSDDGKSLRWDLGEGREATLLRAN